MDFLYTGKGKNIKTDLKRFFNISIVGNVELIDIDSHPVDRYACIIVNKEDITQEKLQQHINYFNAKIILIYDQFNHSFEPIILDTGGLLQSNMSDEKRNKLRKYFEDKGYQHYSISQTQLDAFKKFFRQSHNTDWLISFCFYSDFLCTLPASIFIFRLFAGTFWTIVLTITVTILHLVLTVWLAQVLSRQLDARYNTSLEYEKSKSEPKFTWKKVTTTVIIEQKLNKVELVSFNANGYSNQEIKKLNNQ